VWDKVSWELKTWLPILSGVMAALLYGVASNSMKKYLSDVSTMTKSGQSIFRGHIYANFASVFLARF